jgi:tyrosinase
VTDNWVNGKQNNDDVVQTLRDYKFDPDDAKARRGNLTASLRDAFYRIFTIENYLEFSCNPPSRKFRQDMPFDSVEDIHNNMHVWAGGSAPRAERLPNGRYSYLQGHMSDPGVAAFDPLFWFHHK